MGINAIGLSLYSSSAGYYHKNILPEWLLQKLIENGIDPTNIKSVNEAMQKLQAMEQLKQNEQTYDANSGLNNSNDDNRDLKVNYDSYKVPPKDTSEGNEIRKKAELLADRLGINYSDNINTVELLNRILNAIQNLYVQSAQKQDRDLYEFADECRQIFNSIGEQIVEYNKTLKNPDNYMELLAQYNKNYYGLNN